MDLRTQSIAKLLEEAGQAHHDAFLAQDGDDPEWPLWYATYLRDRLPQLLGRTLTRSELVYALVHLDRRMTAEAPPEPWPAFYANYLVETYA